MSSSDPLVDYRRLAAERRNRLLGNSTPSTSSSNDNATTTSTTTTSNNNNTTTSTTTNVNNTTSNPSSNTTSSPNTNNNTSGSSKTSNSKKLKLIEKSNEEILKEREAVIPSNLISILNPNTEKKKYLEKLNNENDLKREREEKEKLLKQLRNDPHIGKKSKSIDYPNIDNSLKLNSPTKPNQVTETIFESELEENEPCIIQIRFIDGSTNKVKFESNDKLLQICQYIFNSEKGKDYKGIKIKIPLFKIKYFNNTNIKLYNLKELELTPNGNLIIENDESEFAITKNDLKTETVNQNLNYLPVEYILQNFGASYRLKGDTLEEKEKFRDRQREKEIEIAKIEKLKKKKEMEQVRRNLELDKMERLEKLEKLNANTSNIGNSSNNSSSGSTTINIGTCNVNTLCSIQVRLPNGNCVKIENVLYGKNSLYDLYQQVKQSSQDLEEIKFEDLQFRRQYPNMDFDSNKFKKVTLLEAQLVPRGLIVLAVKKQ